MAKENYYEEMRYKLLEEKYPHIKYVEGEDLNLERAKLKIVKACVDNRKRFKTINSIAQATGINRKSLSQIIKKHELIL